jgi:hypothetical protein
VIEALADEMMGTITKVAQDYATPNLFKQTTIMISKLVDDAGITGAAVLARSQN